jgi:hypothetical protein
MRRPALLVLVAALACGTAAGQRAAQSLKPAADTTKSVEDPLLSCVDAVNQNSKRFQGVGVSVKGTRGTPRLLIAEVRLGVWSGAYGMAPPPDRAVLEGQNQTLMDAAARALREVRAECAPNAPGEPVCVKIGDGRTGRCTLGAG